jgi:Cu2+-exporting ATPase
MQVVPSKIDSVPETNLETFTLDVGGMKCAGCVKTVENQLTQQPGVISATVNLVTEVAVVKCEVGAVNPTTLAEQLTASGFPSQLRHLSARNRITEPLQSLSPVEQQRQHTQQQIQQATIAITLLILSTLGHLDHFGWVTGSGLGNIWLHCGLATIALIGPGRSILVDGWQGLCHNVPNMNTLVGLGTLTAYFASLIALLFPHLDWECFFDEPVMLVGFILLGRTLEQQARSRAADAFQSLLALQPLTARLVKNKGGGMEDCLVFNPHSIACGDAAQTVEVPAAQVKVGEWLQVLPGEKIPVDGEIVAGQTTVDESMLTGESMPVLKQSGDRLATGSLNLSGAILLKAARTGKDTALAQIIALVEEAQARKAPIQKLADVVAGYFAYGVMTIALLTFLFWYFVGVPLWSEQVLTHGQWVMGSEHAMHGALPVSHPPTPLLLSLKLAIAVLVIACPCALGLATPTAILVSSGIGAEQGLLIRGGDVLEKVNQLQTIVFDKTGTLTLGYPIVTDCIPVGATLSRTELLQIAASVESGTQHPVAKAIQNQANQQALSLLTADHFHTQPGMGISALVNDQQAVLGTPDWLIQHGVEIDEAAKTEAERLALLGKTIVYVAVSGKLVGLIAVQDTLRPDAMQTIDRLHQMGLRVVMMTGDHKAAAESIACMLGLDSQNVLANVHPQEKGAAIAHLQQQGQQVAMVGDGINDALALAQADVGIALHSGTDVAMETASIVLMRDRLSDVVAAIHLSQATFNKIRQNLFWAFAYNLLGIPVAAGILLPSFGILLSPAIAGAFMAFSSVSVVINSLLLRHSFAQTKPCPASGSCG